MIAKVAFFLSLASCGLQAETAFGTKLARRQSCQPSILPNICRPLLSTTIEEVIITDTTTFLDVYCGTCADSLYNYFEECESGSNNANKFDFFCSSNAKGERCLTYISVDSFAFNCLDEGPSFCNNTCQEAIILANQTMGCCFFSTYAFFNGQTLANSVFETCNSDNPRTLCVGGASGQNLQLPPESFDVDPKCEQFVKNVDESCQNLLGVDIIVAAYGNLDQLCGHCAYDLYIFSENCDRETTFSNATVVDELCAVKDPDGEKCGTFLFDYSSSFDYYACANVGFNYGEFFDCPAACRETLEQSREKFGCCLPLLLDISYGNENNFIDTLFSLCNVDFVDGCVGGITNEPVFSPGGEVNDNKCQSLRNKIPEECRGISTFEFVSISAEYVPDSFQAKFCKTDCANPLYEYFNECVGGRQAAYLDYLCSESSIGKDCVTLVNDDEIDIAMSNCMHGYYSGEQCSSVCQTDLQSLNDEYGCCLLSYFTYETNITYSNSLWAHCGIDNPGLCAGGISEGSNNGDMALQNQLSSTVLFTFVVILSILL